MCLAYRGEGLITGGADKFLQQERNARLLVALLQVFLISSFDLRLLYARE